MTTPLPPPGYQNPYQQQPPQRSPRRGTAWLWVALGAAALVIVCCGLGAVAIVTGVKYNASGQGGEAPSPEATAAIGEPVQAGKFEFVVNAVECGVDQVGEGYVVEKAQGQFCLVTLQVKNTGDEPETLLDQYQKGFGTNGAVYSANSAAGVAANDLDSQVWTTEINPGNEMTGVVVYDLPKGVELAQVELHDSSYSGTATVDLK